MSSRSLAQTEPDSHRVLMRSRCAGTASRRSISDRTHEGVDSVGLAALGNHESLRSARQPVCGMQISHHGSTSGLGQSSVTISGALDPRSDLAAPFPRNAIESWVNITHRTRMPRGGHSAELEEPDPLADDIRTFFRPYLQPAPHKGADSSD